MTNYVVLRKSGNAWFQFTAQYAASRKAAIQQSLVGTDPADYAEAYQAIPARYWNPNFDWRG